MLMSNQTDRPQAEPPRALAGRAAIVTGSTSGIGLGIAEALASRGANVVINGFGDANEIERLRARLAEEHGVNALFDGADMRKPAAIACMVGRAVDEFGRV